MELTDKEIADWIAYLKGNVEAAAVVQPSGLPSDPIKKPATWRVGIYASAFFHVPESARSRLAKGIPALHARFQALTGHALTLYQNGETGSVSKSYTQEKLEADFRKELDGGVATINGYDGGTKETSPQFAIDAVARFRNHIGKHPMLNYLSIKIPPSFWCSRRSDFTAWWLDALELLRPEQAYLGLAFANPPILERWPFVETAELALAQTFYGLDVDKPFFMRSSERDGMHLESGHRTPTYGVLLHGNALLKLGGKAAVEATLRAASTQFRLTPCLDGWWVEAGDAPRLYPVEEGIPPLPAALATLTRPLRLDCLRLVSYNPNVPDERRFTPAAARRWLKRFDADGDWPNPEVRRPVAPATPAVVPNPEVLTALPGQSCPETGDWYAHQLADKTVFVEKGRPMPGPEFSATGKVIWHLRKDRK